MRSREWSKIYKQNHINVYYEKIEKTYAVKCEEIVKKVRDRG